jgi:LETM1 and EF-hand domain-containing protein 1
MEREREVLEKEIIGQLEDALIALRGTSLESKYHSLFSVLDEDHDGNIKLEEIVEKEGQFHSRTVSKKPQDTFTAEEIIELSHAVSSFKGTLVEEKQVLKEIKEDRDEFIEDVADLASECAESEEQLIESVASKRIGHKVESMLTAVNKALSDLEHDYILHGNNMHQSNHLSGNDITVGQLEDALIALRGTSLESKYHSLFSVLDEDHDGNIKLEEIVEVVETLADGCTDIDKDHISHIKYLIRKYNKQD